MRIASLEEAIPSLAKLSSLRLISETVPSNSPFFVRAGTERWNDVWKHKYFVILKNRARYFTND